MGRTDSRLRPASPRLGHGQQIIDLRTWSAALARGQQVLSRVGRAADELRNRTPDQIRSLLEVQGREHVERAMAAGRGAVLISGFVALTLSPMMCRFLLKERHGHNWLYRRTEPFFVAMNNAYERTLGQFLRVRFVAVPLSAALLGYMLWGFGQLKRELAPLDLTAGSVRAVDRSSAQVVTIPLARISRVGAEPQQA